MSRRNDAPPVDDQTGAQAAAKLSLRKMAEQSLAQLSTLLVFPRPLEDRFEADLPWRPLNLRIMGTACSVIYGLFVFTDMQLQPEGKAGLLNDRPVFLIIACGGSISTSLAAQTDFLTPYLRCILATVGLRDVSILRLENLHRGVEAIERTEAQIAAWIKEQTTTWKKRQCGGCSIF